MSHHDQPGLEVVTEPEGMQVVRGPETPKTWDPTDSAQYTADPPQFYPQSQSPVNGGYGQYQNTSAYPNDAYYNGSPQATAWPPATYDGSPGPGMSEKGTTPTICGMRRRQFWIIFSVLATILVVGLAVGLGVGLSASHNSNNTSAASSTSTSTSSAASTSSSATSTPTVATIACPSSNNSYYDAADSKEFMVLCDVDYNSVLGTQDLDSVVTDSIEACADTCAGNGSCVGAGWGNYQGTTYCWMKSSLGSPQSATNWFFVIKQ